MSKDTVVEHDDFANSHHLFPRKYIFPFMLLASCFMWWGIANNLTDPLVKVFISIFPELSTFQSSLIQFAFYGGYFCLAIPGAIITRKFSYKTGVLIGLGMYAGGCLLLLPASLSLTFWSFLGAFWVLASGLSILETSANPYILSLGSEETATQRLNLAQAFNPVGSIVGILLCGFMIMEKLQPWKNPSTEAGANAFVIETAQQPDTLAIVIAPYLVIAAILVLIWLAILFTKMPTASDPDKQVHFAATFVRLFKNSNYLFAVVAQFFYVGAQITVWTYTNFYIPEQLGVDQSDVLLNWHIWALVSFGVCRFVFTWLMHYFKDSNLLATAAIAASILSLLVIFVGGMVGSIALIAISAFMSLMFPTIFGLGCRGLGSDTKVGASGLIMAILGGALITPLQGWVIDQSNVSMSYIVPLVCFVVIAFFAFYSGRVKIVADKVVSGALDSSSDD